MASVKSIGSLLLVSILAVPAWADIAPSPRRENARVTAGVEIRYGAIRGERTNVKAKIVIPAYLVAGDGRGVPKVESKEGGAPKEGAPRKEEAPKEGASPPRAAPEGRQSSLPPLGTTVAGIALSLAAVSVVFLVRGNKTAKTTAVIALVSAGLLGGWSLAQADLVVPGQRGEPVIVIELSDDAETVSLLIAR
ncbi:MAG: hypothetical protein SFU86_19385 [Pirellulaceae bacterium]|nr:hypothetical protein [Pirellulaceae bacterium]